MNPNTQEETQDLININVHFNEEKQKKKMELRLKNLETWNGTQGIFKTASNLDASLKKNTAFIKRLRAGITGDVHDQLMRDLKTLSLEKYISEIVGAVIEGLQKSKTSTDIFAAIEVVSALHQRFSTLFTPFLTFQIARGLTQPLKSYMASLTPEQREKEDSQRLLKQRILLRVSVELWLVGVLRTLNDAIPLGVVTNTNSQLKSSKYQKRSENHTNEPFVYSIIKDIIQQDRDYVNLPLIVTFVRNFATDIFCISQKRLRKIFDGNTSENSVEFSQQYTIDENISICPFDIRENIKLLLQKYFDNLKEYIVKEHRNLKIQEKSVSDASVSRGEINEDRQNNLDRLEKHLEKLINNAKILADILGLLMPDLKDQDEDTLNNMDSCIRISNSFLQEREEITINSLWEDDDQKKFYEDIIDLKDTVPSSFLTNDKKQNKESEMSNENKPPPIDKLDEMDLDITDDNIEAIENEINENDFSQEDLNMSKGVGIQIDAYITRLPELNNRDMIDQAAIDFCFLNSKASRNRLIKVLCEPPRNRQDIFPYYSRLIVTLSKYMPTIRDSVVEYLIKQFKKIIALGTKDLELRTRNSRYLSELIKFNAVPHHLVFHCFKLTIDKFSKQTIETLCILLEECGRFLFRHPETNPRMVALLETIMRKKNAQNLGQQERLMIENAFYYVNPPEQPVIHHKIQSVEELYIRKLIYYDLNKKNYPRILKQLRKLHWENPEMENLLFKLFLKVWDVRFNNIHLLAILIKGLSFYHHEFTIKLVDSILELIRVGLEENNYKYNQRQIALIRYLGELYNYKIIDTPVIFDTLYTLVIFGHAEGRPHPDKYTPIDPPDDFFRIHLVCTLLDTCGLCFDRGSSRKKLDIFLAFFQYYIYTKHPLTMDVEFVLQDTMHLIRSNLKLASSLEEAAKGMDEIITKYIKPYDIQTNSHNIEDSTDTESFNDDDVLIIDEHETEIQEKDDMGDNVKNDSIHINEDDEIIVFRREQRNKKEEEEFDHEFSKIIAESLETRKFDRKGIFDPPLPIKRQSIQLNCNKIESSDVLNNNISFTLLVKRGNRPMTYMVDIPSDSALAISTRTKKEAEKQEQQHIKSLVLKYEQMDDDEKRSV
ncbi:uncharacterized protein T551_02783 [Pneumocystis jirovecii RU7]|uniref:MIF4G domain-containing protein n=1 Tax=Pneumocystis jirovecii (strain RU7) TaxID=1408657 RepID=A0A0W4ZHH9_PNEJ7|nr:uncharacterized protein T551_02783 [Pneumocystis jirovecii RU7]KTW27816.1 hypothetical protein T551_02783 [Pneumocystis jirovecii RU7]